MSRWEPRSNRASHTPDTGGSAAPKSRVPPNVFGASRISVVVVEGEPAVGSGGADAVGPPIQVVGHVSVGPDAVALVERVRPDVVLLQVDATCPAASDTIEALRANHPLTRIVVADVQHEGAAPEVVGDEGGCVVTDSAFADVVAGIQRAAGEGAESPAGGGGAAVRRHGVGPALTRREHEILRLVALGNTNNEIAQRLGLAANTVKTYWQRALHKLSARNRAEAIARAHDLRLI
jgi:two-component system, NarL family, nitrate/nitrite response regulator NarL